jgi:hypothetical protein
MSHRLSRRNGFQHPQEKPRSARLRPIRGRSMDTRSRGYRIPRNARPARCIGSYDGVWKEKHTEGAVAQERFTLQCLYFEEGRMAKVVMPKLDIGTRLIQREVLDFVFISSKVDVNPPRVMDLRPEEQWLNPSQHPRSHKPANAHLESCSTIFSQRCLRTSRLAIGGTNRAQNPSILNGYWCSVFALSGADKQT